MSALHTKFKEKGRKTDKWYYYIYSRKLTVPELLHHAWMEWVVESIHWLLDVHFGGVLPD